MHAVYEFLEHLESGEQNAHLYRFLYLSGNFSLCRALTAPKIAFASPGSTQPVTARHRKQASPAVELGHANPAKRAHTKASKEMRHVPVVRREITR